MKLLAQGRDCDVFDLEDGTVLRRRRRGRFGDEATVMAHVLAHGFPCPRIHRADGREMVLERVDGPTMAQSLVADPRSERLRHAGVALAELHRRLHEVAPLPGHDGVVLHLDLHPENVLVTADGPVVIDWTNAMHGPPELDVAMTWVILEPLGRDQPAVRLLLDAFLEAAGRDTAELGLPEAAARRLVDPNITEVEAHVVATMVKPGRR